LLSTKADSVRLYKIRKVISELSGKEGRGTELVSLYIPPKKPIHEVIAYLRNEWGTAGNIKSDTTRNHVQDALTKTMQKLKLYRETPDNGLVIFCGALMTNGPGSEVIVLREVVPPKPVKSFLYQCVSPDTNILMGDGTQKTIGALKSSWGRERVMSWDAEGRKIVDGPVQEYLNLAVDGRRTYKLTVESGRSILATEDHPFRTPKGWVRLGHIRKGDFVCVLPLADLASKEQNSTKSTGEAILTEESLRQMPNPPKNLELAIKRLKERGLIPLSKESPKLKVVARILGHVFSDGSLFSTTEQRRGGPYTYFTTDFCLGSKLDEEEVRRDIRELGAEAPAGYPTTYTMNVDGRSYTGHTIHVKLRDSALCTLLRAVGAPVGRKVVNGTCVPSWIMQSSLEVQREFLAAYLGGDGSSPRMRGRNLVGQTGVGFHRIVQKKDSGLAFADQLTKLLSRFGVVTRAITCVPGYRRKDGLETVEISLRFKLSEENVVRLCHAIGVRYCSRKASKASLIGEYLRVKSCLREENGKKMLQARKLRSEGVQVEEIGQVLVLTRAKAIAWSRGRVKSPLVKAGQLPTFEEWSRVARTGVDEPLLWESVSAIEEEPIQDVRDLTVSDTHSFFANGFLVHNCDDHFHVEYLKDMLREEKVYGILSIDANEAGVGILSGETFEVVNVMTSGISGKTRKGGQSARRYERGREMELTYFYHRVADHANRILVDEYKVTGLIVGGPGYTKEDFLKTEFLNYNLRKNMVAIIDTAYSGREGVRELVDKAADKLQDVRLFEEKKLVQRFLGEVNKPNGVAVYGLPRIMQALDKSNVETILVADDVDTLRITATCKSCGTVKEKFVPSSKKTQATQELTSEPCSNCGSKEFVVDETDLVDLLEERASQVGAKVEVISSGTEEGAMLKSFGGVAAFLRYRPAGAY
jgi:peptide chain release factor subunit 1